ncbi:LysR family transcriptional regulator [Streptomyces sp. SCA3-4]|uniref:LysR family transcriptional regulator n=1 Tax=Streptomyces sichuanensis TaxID=2871810 RepID=UPI001CE2DF68|nr:LysR family transcriptional regulator [Streptomyces sichuanensis]MCA6092074.1 LysR family transcriptional regulator [Streptomyces sichuanensis]
MTAPGAASASGIELRHLRALATVARCRSFTRAAEELLITQPALSRTVAQLEAGLGVRLLERSSRGVALTDTGAGFLVHAERTLAAFDAALAAARHESTLRLGFSWLLPDPWAQRAIARFERETGAQVELVRCDDPLDDLDRQGVDVALVRGDRLVGDAVRTVHLYDEHRVAVRAREEAEDGGRAASRGHHPEAVGDAVRWQDAREWTLVVNTASGTTGSWCWPHGDGPRRYVQTANFDEWLESVAAGRGLGIVPDVAERRIHHPALRFLPLTGAPPSPVRLAYRPEARTGSALLRRFLDAAIEAAATCIYAGEA